jgi:hypothetical protein
MANGIIETTNLAQFNNLINELINGGPKRAVFAPWEMELLLDLGNCRIRPSSRQEVLRRYQRCVQKHFLRSQYKFPAPSSFLAEERARRRPHPVAPPVPQTTDVFAVN